MGRKKSHGMSETTEYTIWTMMRQRCGNPNATDYDLYGGRGITVCARWQESFQNFYADMGPRPEGKTLDRIDNDAGYSPDNCHWATQKEQATNQVGFRNGVREYTDIEMADWFYKPVDVIRRIAKENPGIGSERDGILVFVREDRKRIRTVMSAEEQHEYEEASRKAMECYLGRPPGARNRKAVQP